MLCNSKIFIARCYFCCVPLLNPIKTWYLTFQSWNRWANLAPTYAWTRGQVRNVQDGFHPHQSTVLEDSVRNRLWTVLYIYIYEHSPILFISTLMMEKVYAFGSLATLLSFTRCKDPTTHSTLNIILLQNFRKFFNNKMHLYHGICGTIIRSIKRTRNEKEESWNFIKLWQFPFFMEVKL
jgi:hypothetical protein